MAPIMTAAPLIGSIQVDGILDETAWQNAEPTTSFTQLRPNEGESVSERTEVRVLVGSDALYIGARLFDSEPDQIRAALVRRDVVSDFDYMMVYLDSRHDHNTSFIFVLTPSGAFQDAALGADGQLDLGWDPVWEGAATVDGQGWSAEWKIPFSQLRFGSEADAEWGIQVLRMIRRKGEQATFAFVPLSEQSGPHRYGHLRGLGQLHAHDRLELLPYATTRSEHLKVDPENPFRSNADQFHRAGLDLKYGISASLTLDATVNPDFGQVGVDPAVVNLSDYETYFPERRPFFVEGAEIFRFGSAGSDLAQSDLGSLFYSRRIGAAPHRGLSDLDASYTDVPEQTTIGGAVKVSGRVGEDWSAGLMEAVTLEEEGRFVGQDGVQGSTVVEPLSSYLVGRARRDFRDGNSAVGGIVTAVNRDLSDPALGEILHAEAYVAGLDLNHSWKNREWFVSGTVTGSLVRGSQEAILLTQESSARYWQRPDAGHVEVDPTRTSMGGWSGSLSAGRSAGDHWLGAVLLQAQSPGFEANDLGFVPRVDARGSTVAVAYQDQVPNRLTRSYTVDLSGSVTQNFDGDWVGMRLRVGSAQQWANYWRSSTSMSAWPETDNDRLTRGGPVSRHPSGISLTQSISTDPRRPYTVRSSLNYQRGGRGGWGFTPSLGTTFRPSPALEVSLSPTFKRAHSVMQYVRTVPDETADQTYGARYVFSDLDQTSLSLDTRVSWTFTPRLSLQLFAQPFLATGDYSRFKELREPRKWGWDVYGEDTGTVSEDGSFYTIDPDGTGPAEPFSLGNPDFNIRSLRGNAVLRWEYRPGSSVYLVWQQRRYHRAPTGEFDGQEDVDALFNTPSENVFALKVSYWWGR